jgi:hypothetical protein
VVRDTIPAGIPQYFQKQYLEGLSKINKGNLTKIESGKRPKVFAVDDLSFGFVIWLIACSISISVFISELILWWIKDKISKYQRNKKRKRNKKKLKKIIKRRHELRRRRARKRKISRKGRSM